MDKEKTKQKGHTLNQKPKGRPRDMDCRSRILKATYRILLKEGYMGTSIESIARKANVGKKTIYRWWNSKPFLVLEVISLQFSEVYHPPDTGSLAEDVSDFLNAYLKLLGGNLPAILNGLAAETQLNPEFSMEIYRLIWSPREKSLITLLERGVQRKEIPKDINLETLAEMIIGSRWFTLMFKGRATDPSYVEQISSIIKYIHPK